MYCRRHKVLLQGQELHALQRLENGVIRKEAATGLQHDHAAAWGDGIEGGRGAPLLPAAAAGAGAAGGKQLNHLP